MSIIAFLYNVRRVNKIALLAVSGRNEFDNVMIFVPSSRKTRIVLPGILDLFAVDDRQVHETSNLLSHFRVQT